MGLGTEIDASLVTRAYKMLLQYELGSEWRIDIDTSISRGASIKIDFAVTLSILRDVSDTEQASDDFSEVDFFVRHNPEFWA